MRVFPASLPARRYVYRSQTDVLPMCRETIIIIKITRGGIHGTKKKKTYEKLPRRGDRRVMGLYS